MKNEELHPWLRKMIHGDQEAFKVVYEKTKNHVYQTVSFLLNNQFDVCDVVSEVYIELFKSLPNYDFEKQFHSWFNGLILRQIHNWNRKIWRKVRLFKRNQLLEVVQDVLSVDESCIKKESKSELMCHVQKLSYKLKEVIIMRYYHDYSLEEIAELLSIPVGTVKSRQHLAIQQLRRTTGFSLETKEENAYVN